MHTLMMATCGLITRLFLALVNVFQEASSRLALLRNFRCLVVSCQRDFGAVLDHRHGKVRQRFFPALLGHVLRLHLLQLWLVFQFLFFCSLRLASYHCLRVVSHNDRSFHLVFFVFLESLRLFRAERDHHVLCNVARLIHWAVVVIRFRFLL